MPPKAKMPAPIDRPLSRAYLREFSGWSTAYPPGASDPTSLRKMENLLVNRDGSVRIRPGLRHVSYAVAGEVLTPGFPTDEVRPVSSHEPFYLNDGRLAYLIAFRSFVNNRVEFCVGILDETSADGHWSIVGLDAVGVAFDVSAWPTVPFFTTGTTYVRFLQIDNKILALSNNGEQLIVFYVGATKKVIKLSEITQPSVAGGSTAHTYLTTPDWLTDPNKANVEPPDGLVNTLNSLSSSDQSLNDYNIGFFYSYGNEIGEGVISNVWLTSVQRPWGSWSWAGPFAADPGDAPEPVGAPVSDSTKTADHIIVRVSSEAEWNQAKAEGATKMSLYMLTWSKQDSVPVEAILLEEKPILPASTYALSGYWHVHPGMQGLGSSIPIPTKDNRVNTTAPPRTAQGLVAADRLVLVNDPTAAAVIRWSTNEPGNYLNLSPWRGGGVKTLTSGNMQTPAVAKLWQNPQSADTIIVLNSGSDSYSTAYYMAPATVTSQSDNTIIMGFEETTATPGTTSPYGCEVANNALYHPLDDQLMKSTASNYNINHKAMTDQIVNKWTQLADKHKIVSCFFDQRIYFLVHNPDGAALEAGCMGNEVWVLDLSAEGGNWSRWLVQGVSLRKTELKGRVYLSLARPDGISVFDDAKHTDTVQVDGELVEQAIPWLLESNTQGANRAHDAFAHLQQANMTFGMFTGTLRYGVRGVDIHGQRVNVSKRVRDVSTGDDEGLTWDYEDQLLIQKQMKEWFLYASSVVEDGVVQPCGGQITLVQYRYAPITVNVGFENGSVETFEYGREGLNFSGRTTDNGVPQPMVATERP